ncbi:restriction endonuclease subunit S [Streptomyces sp. NPDC059409]|uniref:restriction endonuclease subunit S n=1 Tax=Streptomyces sp. NPDC059409 TaxID=3346824 RepID=UPI0036C6479F
MMSGAVDARWEQVPLVDVLDFQEGPGIMARDFRESGIPLIRLAGLKRQSRLLAGCKFLAAEMVSSRWAHFRLQEGDVLLSTSASLGEIAAVDQSGVGAIAYTGIVRFRPRDGRMLREFIPHALVAPSFKRQIEAMGVGSVIRHFGPMHLRQMTVSVPPLEDQGAITEVLGALDDKIALNEQIAETVLDLAGCLYQHESEHDRWPESDLKDTAKWLSGGTPKTSEPSYWGGDIPWISAASLKTPWLYESERSVTELGAQNGTRLVPKGTILFVVRGMSLTTEFRVGIAEREVAFGQDCKALIPHADIDPATLFLAVRAQSPRILKMVDLAGHGTGRLVTERVANLRVRLPQGETAAGFAARAGALMDRAVAVTNENRTLADLRDTLLPQLLSGKLRVKDAVRTVEEVV